MEGVCLQGNYSERVDADGNHVFVAIETTSLGQHRRAQITELSDASCDVNSIRQAHAMVLRRARRHLAARHLLRSLAHHSTTMFDHTKTLTIGGDRRGAALGQSARQPLRSKARQGAARTARRWLMEMTCPGNLVRAGGWRGMR